MFASMGWAPMLAHKKFRQEVRLHNDHVQALTQTTASHARERVDAEDEVRALKVKQDEALSTIRNSVAKLDDNSSPLLPEFIKALPSSDRALIREQLPILFPATKEMERDVGEREKFSNKAPKMG